MNHLPPSGASQQPGQDLWQQPGAQAAGNTAWEREVLERLVLATVNEQRAARRWRIFWRLLWMGLFGAAIWFFGKEGATTTVSGPHTAVVEIKGEIASGADASAEFVNAAMRSALEDSGSKALVLLINSPGGSPVQAGMINDEILRLKALHQKPVYAVVEETCASAAYYIAAAADEIYVDKASLVGSIGVLLDGFGFTGTMEKLGVERRLLTAGANKGMLDPFSPMSPEQREHAQEMLDTIHQQFITVVQKGGASACMQRPTPLAACSGRASRPWPWAWPINWGHWTLWPATLCRPKTSSTTPAATTWPNAWPSALVRPWARGWCRQEKAGA